MPNPGASSRASTAVPGGSSAVALAKLIEKKKEYEAVSALEHASALYLERIEGLGEDCDIMADAGAGEQLNLSPIALILSAVKSTAKFWHNGPRCFKFSTSFVSTFQSLLRFSCWRCLSVGSREGVREGEADNNEQVHVLPTRGQRLIRVPIEDLQEPPAH